MCVRVDRKHLIDSVVYSRSDLSTICHVICKLYQFSRNIKAKYFMGAIYAFVDIKQINVCLSDLSAIQMTYLI